MSAEIQKIHFDEEASADAIKRLDKYRPHDDGKLEQGPAARVVRELIQEFDNADNPPVNLVIAYKKANGEVGLLAVEGTSFLEQLGLVDVARQAILQQNLKA